jgi:DNA-binding CsgD family transcriptional regulator
MVTNKIKQLTATKAKIIKLEKSIAAQLSRELAALPRKYGFESTQAFIKAVRAAGGKTPGAARRKSGAMRRKRAVITADTKAKVKALVSTGKTGAEIAKAAGISLPSVQNIKKELGLVKKRG